MIFEKIQFYFLLKYAIIFKCRSAELRLSIQERKTDLLPVLIRLTGIAIYCNTKAANMNVEITVSAS